jgi:hypothetical protein
MAIVLFAAIILGVFVFAKKIYSNTNFGKTFGVKSIAAEKKLDAMQDNFLLCSKLCGCNVRFMQSIVFPEVMRYSSLKDGIETESLRTLYVQFGEEYANFSIGIFQMKPTFAQQLETKVLALLPDSIYKELQLAYENTNEEDIRMQRVERLQDDNWQLIYLTAFILICKEQYKSKIFVSDVEKLQYYATIYNAGFNKPDEYILKKIKEANFYLENGMPDKKFKYAAMASYLFNKGKH